jgi:ElaB/YqjD/DUF883 family membrane-anchored ribosome-binding protein
MPAINFPTIDLPKIDLPEIDADRVANLARDAAYITVGFGVLTFQKAQVRRQELLKQINASKLPVDRVNKLVETQVRTIDSQIVKLEARLDAVVEQVKDRLPAPADMIVGQAHDVAKTARKQVRQFAVKAA